MPQVEIDEAIKVSQKEPSQFNVVFFNDDTTPMNLVIAILKKVFRHSDAVAEAITMKVHNEGSAVAGTYSHEIAEQKANESVGMSRANGFNLVVKAIEEE